MRERLQGTAEGTSSALHPADLSTASLPGKNKCPGLIVVWNRRRKKTVSARSVGAIEVKGKTRRRGQSGEDRARVGGEEKRRKKGHSFLFSRLVGAAKTS